MISATLIGLALVVAPPAVAAQNAKDLAQEILTKGAALFDKRDAAAMAATYTEDAQIHLVVKDKETHKYKTETYCGRDNIQKGYESLFKDRSPSAVSRNVVEAAHYIGTDILVIHGTFKLDVAANDDPLPFIQVRVKEGDAWRMLNLQLFVVGERETH